jgi:hypothetical protein
MPVFSHPLHLTYTGLEYKAVANRWVMTIKVFSDDFASDVKLATGVGEFSGQNATADETDRILKAWLSERMMIWFDDQSVPAAAWRFDGIRVKEDATIITYSYSGIKPGLSIRIKNTLLMNLYSDQKNLFILTMGKRQIAHEFKIKDQETVIRLNK